MSKRSLATKTHNNNCNYKRVLHLKRKKHSMDFNYLLNGATPPNTTFNPTGGGGIGNILSSLSAALNSRDAPPADPSDTSGANSGQPVPSVTLGGLPLQGRGFYDAIGHG